MFRSRLRTMKKERRLADCLPFCAYIYSSTCVEGAGDSLGWPLGQARAAVIECASHREIRRGSPTTDRYKMFCFVSLISSKCKDDPQYSVSYQ